MGSSVDKEEKKDAEELVYNYGESPYPLKNCLADCPEKRIFLQKDPQFLLAFQQFPPLGKAVLFKFGSPISHMVDVVNTIVRLFIELVVLERIELALTLPVPWLKELTCGGYYEIRRSNGFHYTHLDQRSTMIKIAGHCYSVPRYFWLDAIYFTRICHCPLHMQCLVGRTDRSCYNESLETRYKRLILIKTEQALVEKKIRDIEDAMSLRKKSTNVACDMQEEITNRLVAIRQRIKKLDEDTDHHCQ